MSTELCSLTTWNDVTLVFVVVPQASLKVFFTQPVDICCTLQRHLSKLNMCQSLFDHILLMDLFVSPCFRYDFDYHPGEVYWCTADIGWITGHSYITYGPMANGATSVMVSV